MRELKGSTLILTVTILSLAAVFHLWFVGIVGTMPTRELRGLHLLFFIPVAFLLYPASKKHSPSTRASALDLFLAIVSVVVMGYVAYNYRVLDERIPMVSPISDLQIVFGVIAVLMLLEATRRVIGLGMALVACLSLLYLFAGSNLPGLFGFRAIPGGRIIEQLYLSKSQGMFGQLTGLSATVLILFILFGTFLARSGISDWFADLSTVVAGKWVGGTGKMTILYSALCGSMSGSPTADLYTTGGYTIPLMKRSGFSSTFSAGLAAASAIGAQIMPPVMGASVFIMAAFLSRSYLSIAIAAFPAAILFFLAKWTAVHCEARRRDIPPLQLTDQPTLLSVLARAYYVLPLIALIVVLFIGYSPTIAAMVGIAGSVLVSFAQRKTWLTPRRLVKTLAEGGTAALYVAIPCAAAGIIISALTATGLGLSFTSIIMSAAHGYLFVTLFLVAVVSILLGIGVPTTPAYILVAVVAAPALGKMGVDALAANLFVLYFAVLSNIHPPVGITAYAASGIANSPPMRTGVEAFMIAIPGFMVPVAFCYHPSLLLENGFVPFAVYFVLTAFSVFLISCAIWGFGMKHSHITSRLLALVAGFLLIAPNSYANMAGLALLAVVFISKLLPSFAVVHFKGMSNKLTKTHIR